MASRKNNRTVRRGSSKKRVGLVPDIHLPRADPEAVKWAVRCLRDAEIGHLVLLGDVVTFDAVSRFTKDLITQTKFSEELTKGREFVLWLARQFPAADVTYLGGNHEDRLYRYLLRNAPVIAELPGVQFRHLMGIPEHWKYVPYGGYVMEQGVLIQHGKKWGMATCRGNLLLGCSSIQGHSHRCNMAQHKFADGRQVYAVELGCLCEWDQGYAKLVDWTHACGVLEQGRLTIHTRAGVALNTAAA